MLLHFEPPAPAPLCAPAERLFCTVGVHPTRCGEFDSHPGGPEAYLSALHEVLTDGQADGKVVAVGEMGLDYDRCGHGLSVVYHVWQRPAMACCWIAAEDGKFLLMCDREQGPVALWGNAWVAQGPAARWWASGPQVCTPAVRTGQCRRHAC